MSLITGLQTLVKGVYELALREITNFTRRLRESYTSAMTRGAWDNSYGRYTVEAYFVSSVYTGVVLIVNVA